MSPLEKLISKYYSEVNPEHWKACKHVVADSKSCIDCCGKQYFAGNEINYECTQKRKVYVLRYLPVHQKEVYLALSRIPEEVAVKIAQRKHMKLLSIGSGPGSDILAFKKIIAEGQLFLGEIANIAVSMVEKEPGWDEIADEVLNFDDHGLKYSYKRYYLDFGSKQVKCKVSFDYLFLSYVISELSDKAIDNVAKSLRHCVGCPSVLIINDRNEELVVEKINRLVSEFHVHRNINQSGAREWCGVSYPDEIRETVKPKLKTNSIQFTVVVSQ